MVAVVAVDCAHCVFDERGGIYIEEIVFGWVMETLCVVITSSPCSLEVFVEYASVGRDIVYCVVSIQSNCY